MILKLASHRESSVQVGLFNTLLGPWGLVPSFLGWMADRVGYPWVFALAGIFCLLAFALLARDGKLDGKGKA